MHCRTATFNILDNEWDTAKLKIENQIKEKQHTDKN